MKKINIFKLLAITSIIIIVTGFMLITSCSDEDDDAEPTPTVTPDISNTITTFIIDFHGNNIP